MGSGRSPAQTGRLRSVCQERDPLLQARTRARCLVRRIWTGGWGSRDAEDCRKTLEVIRRSAGRERIALHLIDSNYLVGLAGIPRGAHLQVVESRAVHEFLTRGREKR